MPVLGNFGTARMEERWWDKKSLKWRERVSKLGRTLVAILSNPMMPEDFFYNIKFLRLISAKKNKKEKVQFRVSEDIKFSWRSKHQTKNKGNKWLCTRMLPCRLSQFPQSDFWRSRRKSGRVFSGKTGQQNKKFPKALGVLLQKS